MPPSFNSVFRSVQMAQVINTNINSLNSQRALGMTQTSLATAMQRLSSGLRINSAKDDAAGLAISERMTTQVRGLNQAARNANDGISLAQVAEGAMASIGNNLQRMRELAVQSANATNSASDRGALQQEVAQLQSEIDRVATQTNFNGLNLLDGSFTAQQFQVGANAGQTITVSSIASARTSSLGQFQGFNVTAQSIGTASDTAVAKTVTVGGTAYNLGSVADDAKAIAAALNAQVPGMLASASATTAISQAVAVTGAAADADVLNINGVNITLTNSAVGASNVATAITAINAQSAATGVRAVNDGQGVQLVADDGRNITTTFTAGNAATEADYGLGAAATTGATLNMTYKAPSGVTGTVAFTTGFNAAFTTRSIAATGTSVSAIDISTVSGANAALTSIDAALTSISSSRAALGAVQNRFLTTIDNLQTNSENLTASRSRITDADFAAETAALSRAQILQQAGTAMVAQANQLPQSVLQLLKG
jgi:flagellin